MEPKSDSVEKEKTKMVNEDTSAHHPKDTTGRNTVEESAELKEIRKRIWRDGPIIKTKQKI